ncbi:MAG: hypothetical protein LBJ63_00455 [Prevotellaceae bacterium]|nr:hypothetical protein [Prevotellaceae bacterium]
METNTKFKKNTPKPCQQCAIYGYCSNASIREAAKKGCKPYTGNAVQSINVHLNINH